MNRFFDPLYIDYIGAYIKYWRLILNISQKDISDATGYSIQTVSKLENSKSNPDSVAGRDVLEYVLDKTDLGLDGLYEDFVQFCYTVDLHKEKSNA